MESTHSRRACRLLAAVAALAVVAAFGASSASAWVVSPGEPAYTKTNGNNNFHYQWQAFNGWNGGSNTPNYTYYLCANTYRNGVQVEAHNGTAGPGATNCPLTVRNATGGGQNSGNATFHPFGPLSVLDDGARYTMCVNGYYFDFFIWAQDNSSSNNCPTTVIDRNRPVIGASVNGSDTHTRNPRLNLYIGYEDAVSPPWFGSNGRASNWTCLNRGAPCTPGGNPDPNCSVPNAQNSRVNGFNCQADVSAVGDGTWYFCAMAADAAVPDVAPGTNVTSNSANLSNVACGHVTLDRVGPTVTANSSVTTATVGQLVSFSASATDPAGVSGQFAWNFGNGATGSGAATSHTYTTPGTYQVQVRTTDTLGNEGTATRTIQVNPASGGGGGGGTTPPPGGGGGGTTPPPGDGGGSTTPGTQNGTTGAQPEQQGLTTTVVSQMAGGGGAQTDAVGGLGVIAPKALKLGKAKSLVLALTPETAGKAEVALLRGSKIVAKKGATFGAAGTYSLKLKLPKGLKPGKYAIKVSFTPAGTSKAVTKSLKLKVSAAKRSAKRKKALAPLEGSRGVAKPGKPRPEDRRIKVIR